MYNFHYISQMRLGHSARKLPLRHRRQASPTSCIPLHPPGPLCTAYASFSLPRTLPDMLHLHRKLLLQQPRLSARMVIRCGHGPTADDTTMAIPTTCTSYASYPLPCSRSSRIRRGAGTASRRTCDLRGSRQPAKHSRQHKAWHTRQGEYSYLVMEGPL